jgi:hypothetical protein
MQAACSNVRCFNHFLTGSCYVPPSNHVDDTAWVRAGSTDALDDRLTLVEWFIVAGVCLSPILVFWLVSVVDRLFLRLRLRQHLQRGSSVVADRATLTASDLPADR